MVSFGEVQSLMRAGRVRTWADGYGRWYALVPDEPAAMAVARQAIRSELMEREGPQVAIPGVERVPDYDERGRVAYREAEDYRAQREELARYLDHIATELGSMLDLWTRDDLPADVLSEREYPFHLSLDEMLTAVQHAAEVIVEPVHAVSAEGSALCGMGWDVVTNGDPDQATCKTCLAMLATEATRKQLWERGE